MSPGTLRHDISCRFIIIIIIIDQRRGGVEQRHTITALGNPPHHLEVHKRTKTLFVKQNYKSVSLLFNLDN